MTALNKKRGLSIKLVRQKANSIDKKKIMIIKVVEVNHFGLC